MKNDTKKAGAQSEQVIMSKGEFNQLTQQLAGIRADFTKKDRDSRWDRDSPRGGGRGAGGRGNDRDRNGNPRNP